MVIFLLGFIGLCDNKRFVKLFEYNFRIKEIHNYNYV